MIERIVENWLTKVSETGYQRPFCQLLTGEGYEVISLTRHGPQEEGKDIIAIGPDGIPCAFQLKTGKITFAEWGRHFEQIRRLVEVPIFHPSVPKSPTWRAYLVANGRFDEEVTTEINHRNSFWTEKGYPQLIPIGRDALVRRFVDLNTKWLPAPLTSEKALLELYLSDGRACLSKKAFAEFALSIISQASLSTNREYQRLLASLAVLFSFSLTNYYENKNHVAVIEGWIVYLANLVAVTGRHDLPKAVWRDQMQITEQAISSALMELCSELEARPLVEGDPLVDQPFYRGRVTWLLGLVSALALWDRDDDLGFASRTKEFVTKHKATIEFWGEAAVPHMLALIWYLRKSGDESGADNLLFDIIEGVCRKNLLPGESGIPDPYQELEDVVSQLHGFVADSDKYSFKGRSYTLEGLIYLGARRDLRNLLENIWNPITHLSYAEVIPDEAWQFCLWRMEDCGQLRESQAKYPQSWAELKAQAASYDVSYVPEVLRENPILLLLFVMSYPHRLTKDVAKFLDEQFG